MILMLLILVKFFYFYHKVNVQKNYIYTVIFSTLVVSIFTFGLRLLSIGRTIYWWAYVYYTLSIVMLIDVVYYKHFNQLTTINLLKQIKHLSTVGDSLKELIDPTMLILVLDLIIIPFLPDKIIKFISGGIDFKVIVLIFIIFMLELLYFDKSKQVVKQDLVSYHGIDIIDSLGVDAVQLKKEVNEKDLNKYLYKTNEKDKLFGASKGTNLIIIQVEALQNFLFKKDYHNLDIVPNLNELIGANDSIYFSNMYQMIGRGNTSDAEFSTLTSMHPTRKSPAYMEFSNRNFNSIPKTFKKLGYKTMVFHGNDKHYYNRNNMYKSLGFDKFFGREEYNFKEENKIGFGINDEDFLNQTLEKMLKEEKAGPICSFIITLSSHTPFNMPEKFKEGFLKPEDEDTMVGRYLEAIHYTDKALGEFFKKMKESGLMDRSTIVLYGDHFAISAANTVDSADMDRIFDYVYGYFYDDMMNIPLVIKNKNFDSKVISNTCSQLDIFPTLLNMYGIKESDGIIFGSDIINRPKNTCMPAGYMEDGSFFSDKGFILMDRSGSFKDAQCYSLEHHIPLDVEEFIETSKKLQYEEKLSRYAIVFDKMILK